MGDERVRDSEGGSSNSIGFENNKQFIEELLRSGPYHTIVIGLRVSDMHYILYKRLPREKRRLLKLILEKAIENLAKNDLGEIQIQNVMVNMPISISMNISSSSEKREKPSINVLRQQVSILRDENRRLKEINKALRREITKLKRESGKSEESKVRVLVVNEKTIIENLQTAIDLIERGLNDKAVELLTKLISILNA